MQTRLVSAIRLVIIFLIPILLSACTLLPESQVSSTTILRRVGQSTVRTCSRCALPYISIERTAGERESVPIEHPIPKSICASQRNYDCLTQIEKYQLTQGVSGVERQDLALRIDLKNGNRLIFTDNDDKSSARAALFRYYTYMERIDYHVVISRFWKSGDILLINGTTGAWTALAALPELSPDNNHFALETSRFNSPLRIQIWDISSDKISLNTEFELYDRERLFMESRSPLEWLSTDLLQVIIQPRSLLGDGSSQDRAPLQQIFQAMPEDGGWTATWNGRVPSMPVVDESTVWIEGRERPIIQHVEIGQRVYSDRPYVIEDVSDALLDALYFSFKNNETRNTNKKYVRFEIFQPSTLYVAIDDQATQLPGWMNEQWQISEKQIITNDIPLRIYERHFEPGRVALGGNWMPPATGIRAHYLIMIVPDSRN